jgi:hypothetical protein
MISASYKELGGTDRTGIIALHCATISIVRVAVAVVLLTSATIRRHRDILTNHGATTSDPPHQHGGMFPFFFPFFFLFHLFFFIFCFSFIFSFLLFYSSFVSIIFVLFLFRFLFPVSLFICLFIYIYIFCIFYLLCFIFFIYSQ